jgi:hypothetical protein
MSPRLDCLYISGRMIVKMIALIITMIIGVIVVLHKLGLRLFIRPWSYNVSEYISIQLGNGLINGGGLIPGGGLVLRILRYV